MIKSIMQIESKSQASLEYLIVMGIAIFILTAAISYAIYYQVGYNSTGTAEDLQLAATSIANAVNSISNQAVGSSQQFSFSSPGLAITSSLCNTSLSLDFGGEEASQSLSLLTTGELPLDSGTYNGKVMLVKQNGMTEAELTMDLPISYISTSYVFNPSSIIYNVSFLDSSNNLVGDVNFTLIVYTNSKVVAEQNESTLSGYYSGSVSPINGGQFAPNSVVEIYVPALAIISPSCLLPQRLLFVPTGVINYIPLSIQNNQSVSTPTPFQQEVVVDSADYQQYEASNLQNIEFFYPNGTIINSWLESGNSNTATSTVYWLKLSGVPAYSSITVYMGFRSTSSNAFNNTNDGEAPQLSSTYGEYDDGADVFNFYDNFAGTTLNTTKWNSGASGGTITINNGLTETIPYNAATGSYTYISTSSFQVTSSEIVESYANLNGFDTTNFRIVPVSLTASNSEAWHADNSENEVAGGWVGNAFQNNGIDAETTTSSSYNGFVNSNYITSNNNYNLFSIWYTSSTFYVAYNDETSSYASTTIDVPATPLYITISNWINPSQSTYTTTYPINVQWIRVRAYPPNGVMPSVSFGPVLPQITVFVNGVKDGNNGIAAGDLTNITAFSLQTKNTSIGLMINGTVKVPLGSASLSYEKTLPTGLYNITVFSNNSALKNATYWEAVANIPKGITNFVPISITNLQSSSTSNPFQQNISIDSFAYHNFENQSLNNVEFFYPNGSTIPSWLESGDTAYFDGSNSYANLPENYPYGAGGSFTITVWFKTTSDGVVLWNGNSEQPSSATGYSPIIYVNTNGDLAGGDWQGKQPFSTTYFVANGKWNNVIITQTGSEEILYLNGNEIATSTGTPQSFSPTYWTVAEGYTNGWSATNNGNFYFNGSISNIQFYNQVFTPSKVALLYDEGLAGSPLNNSGLIAWYMLAGNGNEQNGHNDMSVNNVQFNGAASTSTSTTYWLKIGSIVPRESYVAFMGFALPNITLFNNTNDGEAPQLSSTYGKYDDGANVFTHYGGGGSTGWSQFTFVGGTWTTTNGYLQQTSTSGSYSGGPTALIESANYSASGDYILSMAFNYTTEADARVGIIAVATPTSAPDTFGYRFIGQQGSNGAGFLSFLNDYVAWVVNGVYQGAIDTPYTMTITDAGGTWSGDLYSGYSESSSPLTTLAPIAYTTANDEGNTAGYIGISAGYYTGSTVIANPINVMWFFMRVYPPSGVMPSVNVGYLNGQVS